MKKILIATDGSPSAAEAVEYGVELAVEHDATVLFVHVSSPTEVLAMPCGFAGIGAAARVPHVIDELDRKPLEDAEHVASEYGVRSSSKLLVGKPGDEIVAYADVQDVDLIVIGSRGHGTLAGALLGSVSRDVLSESRRPVMVVRAHAESPVEVG